MAGHDDQRMDPGDADSLRRRIAALEKVVVIERRLRQQQEQAMRAATAVPAPPPLPDDSTVLHRPAALAVSEADPDSTMLAPPSRMHPQPDWPMPMRPSPATPAASLTLPSGFRLHEYRIDEVLGQGGFGVTYLATDVHLNAKVAIKEYLPAEVAQRASDRSVFPRWQEDASLYRNGLDNFLVEARTLATFRHPNIVRVARFFEANRTAYMVLEYERGKPLKTWFDKHRDLAEAELLSRLQPLLDGLSQVHGAGFLHRDIKPDNIIVRKHEGSWVLIDFGAARATASSGSALADVVTPGYAPVEQYLDGQPGEQGPWTDIYALGATLYWMVSGAKPPAAPDRQDGAAMVPAVQAGEGRYSESFLRAIDWALRVDAKERPATIGEWSQMLFAAHAGSMGLQDALKAGDEDGGFGKDSLRALLDSPRLLQRRAAQLGRALLKPASWPLVVKMGIAMVVAALAPMLITAQYNLQTSVAAVSRAELHNLEGLASSTAGQIAQLIGDTENLARYLASERELASYLLKPDAGRKGAADAILQTVIRTNPDLDMMILMDLQGNALLSNDAAVAGRNFGFRDYFRKAARGQPFKTGIIVGSATGKRGMILSQPVFGADQGVIGVVVLRIKAASFGAMLGEIRPESGMVPFLVDGDGVLIHHPDKRHLHKSLAPLPEAAQQRIRADQRFRIERVASVDMPELAGAIVRASQRGNITYRSTFSGEEEHAGFAPVPGHNWVVGVTETRSSFEAPLRQLYRKVLLSVVLVGLVFLVLAVLFTRTIVRPVARLTEAANALKEGDYERAHIKVSSNDEIGRLARTFNVMIDVLRQRERERGQGGSGRTPRKLD